MIFYGVRELANGQEPLKVLVVNDDSSYLDKITEYGVRFPVGQSSPTGERVKRVKGELTVGIATGLVHNVGGDQVNVENSFDHIYAFRYRRVEIDGNWFNEYPLVYVKQERLLEDAVEYDYFWLCATKINETYKPHDVFVREDGSLRDFTYESIYEGFRDENNKLRSIPGVHPTVSRSAANFLTDARLNDGLGTDSAYTIQDLVGINYLQHRWTIRLATRNVQDVLRGAADMDYSTSHVTIGEQVQSNQLVLSNSHASGFVIGQSIGDAVSPYRTITNIEIDTPEANQTTITFDGDPADIPNGTNVRTRAWVTGTTDQVAATDGYYKENNGKYPIKIEGIENPYGNIYKNIAGIKVYSDDYYVTKNMKDYNWSANLDNYHKLDFKVPRSNGYATEIGFDANHPWAQLTSAVGGSASTYYADYFYQDYGETSYKTAVFGGSWYNGSHVGLWLWDVNLGLGLVSIRIGARLSYRP